MPFRDNRFTDLEVFWPITAPLPLTNTGNGKRKKSIPANVIRNVSDVFEHSSQKGLLGKVWLKHFAMKKP